MSQRRAGDGTAIVARVLLVANWDATLGPAAYLPATATSCPTQGVLFQVQRIHSAPVRDWISSQRFRAIGLLVCLISHGDITSAATFRVGVARIDITPTRAMPMWGYGDRHAALSTGVLDRLFAKAVVIAVDDTKLSVVGLDLGRAPRDDMMQRIRTTVAAEAGIDHMLVAGSHTHHGPVIELRDAEGQGRGTFDDAVAYSVELEQKIIQVITSAANTARDAQLGWQTTVVDMNRNRHSKLEPRPVDAELAVIRFDDLNGEPIALIVNYAAHPTMLDASDLRFSADWPGQMMRTVERQFGGVCVFMQGAAGDLSTRQTDDTRGHVAYGKSLGQRAISLARATATSVPTRPSIQSQEQRYEYATRVDLKHPITKVLYSRAFFPELARAVLDADISENTVRPVTTTVLLNGELAIVGASGEFFCEHALELKRRSRATETLFFGYCNGHHMYFPTIQAAAEGGYGADATVSWVQLGAGEEMMNRALVQIYEMLGRF